MDGESTTGDENFAARRSVLPFLGEKVSRNDSRVEPLNRSRRRESALTLCLESKPVRRLTSAATRFRGEGRGEGEPLLQTLCHLRSSVKPRTGPKPNKNFPV